MRVCRCAGEPVCRCAGLIDKGLSVFEVQGSAGYVDIVKFGWGTSVVIENLDAKIELCHERGIDVYCCGSLFERVEGHHRVPVRRLGLCLSGWGVDFKGLCPLTLL